MINSASLGCDIVIRGRNEDGSRYEKTVNYKPYFYVENPSGQYTSLFGKKLEKKEFQNVGKLVAARKYFDDTYESDVLHANRYLIDNVKEIPKEPVRVCYLDIETEDREGFPDPEIADKRILSIAFYDSFTQKYTILYNSPNFIETNYRKELTIENEKIIVNHIECKHEVDLLEKFIGVFDALDFDVIYGWNSFKFDFPFIFNRMVKMDINPNKLSPIKRMDKFKNLPQCRSWLDLMNSYKKLNTQQLESFSLDFVSDSELGFGKLEHDEKIGDLWQYNLFKFIEYNIRDVYLMVKLDEKKGMTNYFDTVRRVTFCNWADVYWNSRVLDFYSLKKAHNMGIVLPSINRNQTEKVKGARVLTPLVGIHENVACYDFKSLYPSAILTLNLSPETFIDKNYAEIHDIETCSIGGLYFRIDKRGFVPLLIDELWDLRQQYKNEMKKYKIGSDEYNILDTTQTVSKFLLNSIYGILLYPNSRLFKREVGASVTMFGREANVWVESIIKEKGFTPIYGDSVTKGTKIDIVGKGRINIEDLFTKVDYTKGDKEYCLLDNIYTPTIDDDGFCVNKRVPYIMRHKTNKRVCEVICKKNKNKVSVTIDHSLILFDTSSVVNQKFVNKILMCSPYDLYYEDFEHLYAIVYIDGGRFYKLEKIIDINTIEYNDYVYDIEVENTHRFFANNILVHNTDSCAFKIENNSFEDTIEIATQLCDYINSQTNKWCEDNFGTSKYNRLQIEFESLYNKIVVLMGKQNEFAKKRYVYLASYKDGVDLRNDLKFNMVGVGGKRSDLPKMFRELQKKVFRMILEDKHEDAKKLLMDTRRKITNGEFKPEDISIPTGMSKDIDDYDKANSIHVRAAKYANEYLGENIKREKIKYCYVKRCPPDKPQTNVVAFTEKFPEGFEPDWIKMAMRLVDYQFDTLFRTLGWNINELKGQVTLAAFM